MQCKRNSRGAAPLDGAALQALAVRYVARYATTRARLVGYLARKLAERGWAGEGEPAIEALADRAVAAGFVDDSAFAGARAGALARRGYGQRRLDAALRQSGIDPETAAAHRLDEEAAIAAADAFARRRRIGPYAAVPVDRAVAARHFAAMLRAGHPPDLARRIIAQPRLNEDGAPWEDRG